MSLNRKVSGREMRRHNMAIVVETDKALRALEQNARIDRARIERLEGLIVRSFVGRLKFVVTGR